MIISNSLKDSQAFRSFTSSSTVAIVSLLGSVLEVIEKLRPFVRLSLSVWLIVLMTC